MYVKRCKSSKGRVFLEVVEGYRDERGVVRNKVVKKLGYLDVLDDEHGGDGRGWADAQAKELAGAKTAYPAGAREIGPGESARKNVGYLALKPIYRALRLDVPCRALDAKFEDAKMLTGDVLQFLIYSKVAEPAASKLSAYRNKGRYFENFSFSEEQMYRCLSHIGASWEQIKDYAFFETQRAYGLDTSASYYDGTNFYFEIDREDDFRRKGPNKTGGPEPIVSVGLLLDRDYIPIECKIYPGNEPESDHFLDVIKQMKSQKKITGKTIYIADKGLNTGTNVYHSMAGGDGYIYSQAIKKGTKAAAWVLLDSGYEPIYDEDGACVGKRKSWVEDEAEITVRREDGEKVTVRMRQKQIAMWSRKYAEKSAIERKKLVSKARDFVKSPKGFTRGKIGDAAKFVKFAEFDKNGEAVEAALKPIIDEEAVRKDRELDGYYMIVTDQADMPDAEVVAAYRNLKGIERSFRVQKTYLKLQPCHLSRKERIECHVLVSYLSLLFLRILERKVLKGRFPIERIADSLRDYECAQISRDTYFFFSYSDVVEALSTDKGLSPRMDRQSLANIKNLFKSYPVGNE